MSYFIGAELETQYLHSTKQQNEELSVYFTLI